MCGLVMVLNSDTFFTGAAAWFQSALITSQVRGMDSTGMFQVSKANAVQMFKQASHASDFVQTQGAKTLLQTVGSAAATVGHVRHATAGAIVDANAHPFKVTREDGSVLVGVHNGTIEGWRGNVGAEDHDVDSEWLFTKLANDGAEAFAGFAGAFALIWQDSRTPGHIYVARNEKRELFYAFSANRKSLIAVSELGMLGWLADRHDIKLYKDQSNFEYFYFRPGRIYDFDLKDVGAFTTQEFAAFDSTRRKYEKPIVPVQNQNWRAQGSHSSNYARTGGYSSYGYGSYYDSHSGEYLERRQRERLDGIRRAVLAGRPDGGVNNTSTTGTTADLVDSDESQDQDLEAGMAAAIAAFSREGQTYIAKPVVTSAYPKEVDAAKSDGMFGLVVTPQALWYEEDEKSVYVDFDHDTDEGKVTLAGVIRNITKKRGNAMVFGPEGVREYTICGKFNEGRSGDFYVLSEIPPLKQAQKQRVLALPPPSTVVEGTKTVQ